MLLSNRATAQFKLKRLELALEDVNASLALDPCSFSALRTRARIHVELEHFADAIRDYESAREYAKDQGVGPGELHKLVEETEKAEVVLNQRQTEYYCKILGLSGDYTDAEIKKSLQAREYDLPPKQDEEKFKLVAEAHAALSDSQRRRQHLTGADKDGQTDSQGADLITDLQISRAGMLAGRAKMLASRGVPRMDSGSG